MARMRKRDIRVVYCTGYDIPGIGREVMGPVLRKPVDNDVLINTVRDALASHPASDSRPSTRPARRFAILFRETPETKRER